MDDLHYISGVDALRLFRARELSPVEVMSALIARAEEVGASVNAFSHTFFDEAMVLAREAERRYRTGEDIRPLEGLAVAVKDLEPVEGQPWTMGSVIYKDQVADKTAIYLQRVIDAGGIVHARTTCPEFGAASLFTRSNLWGPTRNPWNLDYAVGGSSGGAGAALAAGLTTLATGSDIGGSIRTPASFNGVVGFKPPYGRVPVDTPENLDAYLSYGPMARSLADTILLQNVIAGPDDGDIASLRPKYELPTSYEGIAGMRIAVSADLGGWPIDRELRDNTRAVADALRSAGAIVDEVEVDFSLDVVNKASCIHFGPVTGFIDELLAEHGDVLSPFVVETMRFHAALRGSETVEQGWEMEAELYSALTEVFRSYDAFICPTVATRGVLADEEFGPGVGVEIDGQAFTSPMAVVPTILFSILGRCPVLSVPSGFADNGVPTGVQIVAPTYSDSVVFRVASAVEERMPWMDTASRRPVLGSSRDTVSTSNGAAA
ncbi:amidase [Microbacterium sp. PMB16]|uniref:amidase n=1 Tax=Microbacterium sp. PMB16 TaxID=3120157 RepID=UPI003F4BC7FC